MFNNIFLIVVSQDVSKFAEKHQAGDEKKKKRGTGTAKQTKCFF